MAAGASVKLELRALSNCDDVLLVWRAFDESVEFASVDRCLGYGIERQRWVERDGESSWSKSEWLPNTVGFAEATEDSPRSKPSNVWPFQRWDWFDHGANNGDIVRYRVSALGAAEDCVVGEDALEVLASSRWTKKIDVSAACGRGVEAYFNRGFVMSQFFARWMKKKQWKLKDIKARVKEIEEPARVFLSGELRVAMLGLLASTKADKRAHLYLALYELTDPELIDALARLKARAHVVLANGSDRAGDGNSDARETLQKAGVDVRDRMLGSKGLGHNKFAVQVVDGVAKAVWSGSANWSASGLCTQVNNGVLIRHRALAEHYFAQWSALADAGDEFTKELVDHNCESPFVADLSDGAKAEAYFTRVRAKKGELGQDLSALVALIEGAKQGILYVMFMPGEEPLSTILSVAADKKLYVRGVASTPNKNVAERFTIDGVDSAAGRETYETALVQPEGVEEGFGAWIKEVTRAQFLFPNAAPGVGHAITHSKMIVVDPFSDDCAVVTGSHNFSASASTKNDENFVIIRGHRALAEAYAIACLSTYQHYRWRATLKDRAGADKMVWRHLANGADWQRRLEKPRERQHFEFWCSKEGA